MRAYPVALAYHLIGPCPNDADRDELRLFVEQVRFERQMASLAKRGYQTLRLDEYANALRTRRRPEKAVLLTFDDADSESIELATPCLLDHGFSAVMFVPVQYIGGRNNWDAGHSRLLGRQIATTDQLKEMARGPWEIASHGMVHADMRHLDAAECHRQLVQAREYLSEIVGRPVLDLAYPYGANDAMLRKSARLAGYRMAFTSTDGVASARYNLPRRPILGQDQSLAFFTKTLGPAHLFYRARPITRVFGKPRLLAKRVDPAP